MKIGIVVPIHNRGKYLADCLWSLSRVTLPENTVILLIDDNSLDQQAIDLFHLFTHPTAQVQRDIAPHNLGIKHILLRGYEALFELFKCTIVINFDSDAVIKPDAVSDLILNYQDGKILTGFNCDTKNANGTERHKIIEEGMFPKRQSVGGINFCVDKVAYTKFVKPALGMQGNFDHNACIKAGGAYFIRPSVVQHIGFESSMGHNEKPDVADDFYYWDLPDVTLIGVDSDRARLQKSFDICTKWIKFGATKLLHVPHIQSKEAYSEFCMRKLHQYVDTSHMLICQHDGYVHNWKAWDNDWLQYDYIGAPWYYTDGMAVGNGGFSLRSKRLMKIVATNPHIQFIHPEDHHICRTYRPYLEETYGIKFAPLDVAEKFSFEGYKQPQKRLKDQFGVHGGQNIQKPVNRRYCVNQFTGLGDILFLVPLIRALMDEGNEITWPIVSEYMNVASHFPDINFVNIETIKDIDFNSMHRVNTPYGELLPYRFAMELTHNNLTQCMQSKYSLYGHDWRMWRNLYWDRNPIKEAMLMQYLNIDPGNIMKYQLVNRHYGEASKGMDIVPKLNPSLPVVEMKTIEGFSLLDWCGVIENAAEIHTANTSILYVLEILPLTMPIHFYKRNTWNEQGYEHTEQLYTKPYILH